MNTKSRRPAGMVAVNQQLSAIAGGPATLKQLLQCFKSNALLRRAFRYALQEQLNPKVKAAPRLRLLAPQAQLQALPKPAAPTAPEQPAPLPTAPAPIAPERPASDPAPEPAKWSGSVGTFGSGTWG